MILRSIALQHGRRAVAKPPVPVSAHYIKRYFASQLDSTAQEPYSRPFQDQQHVDGAIGGSKSEAIHSLPSRTTLTRNDQVAQNYHDFQRQKQRTQNIGATVAPHYQPHTLLSNPPSPSDITLELLLASQSHLGHSTSLWNPANARYIHGIRQGIHIISLDATASHLRRACAVVKAIAERGGLVLFVGTKDGHERAVVKAAQMAGGCHLFDRWIPGSITNGEQILGRCGVKVVDHLDQEISGFEPQLEAKGSLKPDLVVCLNPMENYVLLHECGLNNIPTIGVIDTDANPTWVTYPIPANDDSLRCIQVIAGALGRAGEEGQASRRSKAAKGVITYRATHGFTAPTNQGLDRNNRLDFDPNATQVTDTDREVTSTSDLADDPNIQDALEARMMAAFEYAQFADFEAGAVEEAIALFDTQSPSTQTPEMAELRQKLIDARRTHGVEDRYTSTTAIDTEAIDRELAQELEDEVADMLDEPMTLAEAEALHSRSGAQGENVFVGSSTRSALRRIRDGEDAQLRRMVALKRRHFGEDLSAADIEELKKHDEEHKPASA